MAEFLLGICVGPIIFVLTCLPRNQWHDIGQDAGTFAGIWLVIVAPIALLVRDMVA